MAASIFNGTAVKILKNILRFKDGTEISSTAAGNLVTNAASSTDNALARFDSTTGKIIQNSTVIADDSGNLTGLGTLNTHTLPAGTDTIALLAASQEFSNKTLNAPLLKAGTNFDVDGAGAVNLFAALGANNLTIAGATSTVVIPGSLQVNGTLTWVNTTDLDVTDANITVNKGGNQATADSADAGITIEMSDATDARLGYDSTLASKFAIGEIGSLIEVANVSSTQTFTNKTIDADSNTITNIENADIKAAAAIEATKIADGSVDNTEFQYLNGVTSAIQTQIDGKIAVNAIFDITSSSGVFTATANATHLVDTSGGVGTVTLPAAAADKFVRIKDKGNANTNNITVSPASGTIDGAASDVIDSDYGSVVYVSDGTNWFKL